MRNFNLSGKIQKIKKEQIIAMLLLIIPLNIYVIGDFFGSGIKTSFFHFQMTEIGNSLIFITQDINYIISGVIKGRSAISEFLWILGFCFLLSVVSLLFVDLNRFPETKKYSGIVVILAGILFLTSIIIQYGPLFHGPAGVAIPIGLPVLFIIGCWMYIEGCREPENDILEEDVQLDRDKE